MKTHTPHALQLKPSFSFYLFIFLVKMYKDQKKKQTKKKNTICIEKLESQQFLWDGEQVKDTAPFHICSISTNHQNITCTTASLHSGTSWPAEWPVTMHQLGRQWVTEPTRKRVGRSEGLLRLSEMSNSPHQWAKRPNRGQHSPSLWAPARGP